jgi:hypothetical protein
MNSEPYTVIGVLAPDFWHPLPSDLYVPWPIAQLRAKTAWTTISASSPA